MAAVVLAPHPEPRRPALRLVVSTPYEPPSVRAGRAPAHRRPSAAVYRRRRIGVALALATVVILAVVALRAAADPTPDLAEVTTGAPGAPITAIAPAAAPVAPAASPEVYVVRPGDTVWSIAERLQPEGDVRELVDQLSARTGGSGLQAGQRIALDGLAV